MNAQVEVTPPALNATNATKGTVQESTRDKAHGKVHGKVHRKVHGIEIGKEPGTAFENTPGDAAGRIEHHAIHSVMNSSTSSNPPSRPADLQSREKIGAFSFSRWRLESGLTVILSPDAAAHTIATVLAYRVGSRHEDVASGQTGLAHLFEHLMFTQTQRHPEPGAFDVIMEGLGASTNAYTSYDYTAYVNRVPPDGLATALALEADRMQGLALTPEQIANEKEVVTEERLWSVDDDVDGALDERLHDEAYRKEIPQVPYRHPIIGRLADIKGATSSTIETFYREHYHPSNATLILSGRLPPDERKTLGLVEHAFGNLSAKNTRRIPSDVPARPDEDRASIDMRHSATKVAVKLPVLAERIAIGYPAPGYGSPDFLALKVLQQLLFDAEDAPLPQELVQTRGLCSSLTADLSDTSLGDLFTIWVQMNQGHTSTQALNVVNRYMDAVSTTRPAPGSERLDADPAINIDAILSSSRLAAAKTQLKATFWQTMMSTEGRADAIAASEMLAGHFSHLVSRLEQIQAVSESDVRRVVGTYLTRQKQIVVVGAPTTDIGGETEQR